MYAIFRALGKQFRAEEGDIIRLPRMKAEPGSKVTFDEVLLTADGDAITAGTPLVKGAKVECEVIESGTWSTNEGARRAHDSLGFQEIRIVYRKRL